MAQRDQHAKALGPLDWQVSSALNFLIAFPKKAEQAHGRNRLLLRWQIARPAKAAMNHRPVP
ncbi:hypothetical protein ACSBLW_14395 [Thioclava sp. FR2]|uniref:hypothetical protein n=1 Tax=Thioclava sp. FR2 TaxID=3445780 RepID=UPI003EBF1B67